MATDTPTFHVDDRALREHVANHLRHLIFSGRVRGGDKVNQDATAAELGISKIPVREALLLLEAQGLVVNIPRRGAFVQHLSDQDILDHYRAFGLLSGMATERAATQLSKGDRDALARNLQQFEKSTSVADLEALNLEFHRTILRAGRSNLLSSMLVSLGRTLPGEIFYGREHGKWVRSALEDHREILDALARQDGRAAAEAMTQHLVHGGQHAVVQLRELGALADATEPASA